MYMSEILLWKTYILKKELDKYDKYISFSDSDLYKKLQKRYCRRGTSTYHNFEEAKQVCSQNDGCVGIQGPCDSTNQTPQYEPCLMKPFFEAYNTCVWEKLD